MGPSRFRERESRTFSGKTTTRVYDRVEIEIQGRPCSAEVMALSERQRSLLGRIPLEALDWWVDTQRRKPGGTLVPGMGWMPEML